jgi:hypothetical protein
MSTKGRTKEEGFVLVTIAIILVALLAFVALAIDIGVLYAARTSAQEVADAAALAGAFTFINNPLAPQPGTASNHALQVALNNSIMGKPVTAANVTVNVDVTNQTVTVDVTSAQNTYFAAVLGIFNANVSAEGIGEAAKFATGASCVKPWFIPNAVFATGGDCAGCAAGQVLISGGQVTAFAQSQFGQEFTLKPQNPTNAITPGDFYAIQLPGSVGGNDYRTNIETCATPYLVCGNSYSVETGNLVGPTRQGVNALIGSPATDTWVALGQYQTPNGLSDISKNVVVAPIWDSCGGGFCPSGNFPSGTQVNVQIIGFAVFFLEGFQGSNLKARLVNVSSCGSLSGGSGGNETGGTVLSLPLRLVRIQP